MSTKKVEKKSTTTAVAKADTKANDEGIKLSDGTIVKREGAFVANKDGTFDRCPAERLLAESVAEITIQNIDPKTKTVASTVTYGVHWRKTGNGFYLFEIRTSKALCDEVVKKDSVVGGKLTLLGRGDAVKAAFALKQVWTSWAESFGLTNAYRAVRVALDQNTKTWYALMVPVTEVLG